METPKTLDSLPNSPDSLYPNLQLIPEIATHQLVESSPEFCTNLHQEFESLNDQELAKIVDCIDKITDFDYSNPKWIEKLTNSLKPEIKEKIYFLLYKIVAHDLYTFIHSIRVAKLFTEFWESQNFESRHHSQKNSLESLVLCCLLHDIGKIRLPMKNSETIKEQIQKGEISQRDSSDSINIDPISTHELKIIASKAARDRTELENKILTASQAKLETLKIDKEIQQQLSAEQRLRFHTHSIVGGMILKEFDLPQIFIEMATLHHQRFQNKQSVQSYPYVNIPNQDLSMEVQTLQLIDIWEALTGIRDYKDPYGKESALCLMDNESKTFHPELSTKFRSYIDSCGEESSFNKRTIIIGFFNCLQKINLAKTKISQPNIGQKELPETFKLYKDEIPTIQEAIKNLFPKKDSIETQAIQDEIRQKITST